MNFFRFARVLHSIKVLTPSGLYHLIRALFKYGINLMALLSFTESTYGSKTALTDDNETLSFSQLLQASETLSIILKKQFSLGKGKKVGFLCKNHAAFTKAIFAVNLTGADIYLLNTGMSSVQFNQLYIRHSFDLLLYDHELTPLIESFSGENNCLMIYPPHESVFTYLIRTSKDPIEKIRPASSGKIILLTGGTTGISKEAAHKPSIVNFLGPLSAMINRLKLMERHTAYIATPLYHGYGIAVLFLFIALGKKTVLTCGFDAGRACRLIREHQVDVTIVVPLMLQRMLQYNAIALKSLVCIASGGAVLNPELINTVQQKLGDVLYNLYGTSEAGLNIIATPQDLRYSAITLGRTIAGTRLNILDTQGNEVSDGTVGRFCIKNNWSMHNYRHSRVETGDMGYRDRMGYYYLCGRADDMVISGGENVYPIEVEQLLIRHPMIEDAAVIGVDDPDFGQRLKAFVLPIENAAITREEVFNWLREKAARHQMPRDIVIVDKIPYTALGKPDKKQL